MYVTQKTGGLKVKNKKQKQKKNTPKKKQNKTKTKKKGKNHTPLTIGQFRFVFHPKLLIGPTFSNSNKFGPMELRPI